MTPGTTDGSGRFTCGGCGFGLSSEHTRSVLPPGFGRVGKLVRFNQSDDETLVPTVRRRRWYFWTSVELFHLLFIILLRNLLAQVPKTLREVASSDNGTNPKQPKWLFAAQAKCLCSCEHAGVAELADALDSKSSGRKAVWVRAPPPAVESQFDLRCRMLSIR
jgi:hypothetical protein